MCPFSSRLVVERWERVKTKKEEGEEEEEEGKESRCSKREEGGRKGWGEDRIVLRYNGLVVRTLDGGLAEWKEVYAEALAVRCVRELGFIYPSLSLLVVTPLDFVPPPL